MGLSKVTNFSVNAKARLMEQDKGRLRVPELINAFASEIQEVENAMSDVYTKCGIYTANNTQLDVVGAIVGEARVGRSDEVYRIAIIARIKLNIGAGEPNTIIDAIKQWMNPTVVDFSEPYPAYFSVFIQSSINISSIASLVKEISPAGVGSTVSTMPDGLIPLIVAEVRGTPADFDIQANPLPAALDQYAVSVTDTLEISDMEAQGFLDGSILAEVYLTKVFLDINFGGTLYEYDIGNGDILDLKLINANEDYAISDFGGRLSEVRI
jgi:hypothetical protein